MEARLVKEDGDERSVRWKGSEIPISSLLRVTGLCLAAAVGPATVESGGAVCCHSVASPQVPSMLADTFSLKMTGTLPNHLVPLCCVSAGSKLSGEEICSLNVPSSPVQDWGRGRKNFPLFGFRGLLHSLPSRLLFSENESSPWLRNFRLKRFLLFEDKA